MSSVIEPIHLVAAKEDELLAAPAASSDSEQVVATIAPPIQSHVVAQIPAVDYNVDAPTAPKIIDHFVLSSHIKNPA